LLFLRLLLPTASATAAYPQLPPCADAAAPAAPTRFPPRPGGEAILRNAGGESTDGFFGPQHPRSVFEIIEDFCIGRLID
jgi:hypothetical protein